MEEVVVEVGLLLCDEAAGAVYLEAVADLLVGRAAEGGAEELQDDRLELLRDGGEGLVVRDQRVEVLHRGRGAHLRDRGPVRQREIV